MCGFTVSEIGIMSERKRLHETENAVEQQPLLYSTYDSPIQENEQNFFFYIINCGKSLRLQVICFEGPYLALISVTFKTKIIIKTNR